MIVLRAARCLRPCDRLSNPPSVMFLPHLRIRRNETSSSCSHSLPAEVKSDDLESRKVPEAL